MGEVKEAIANMKTVRTDSARQIGDNQIYK